MTNQTTPQESPLENPMQSLMERPPRSSAPTGFKGRLLAVFMLLVGFFAQQLPLRAESPARDNPLKVLFVGYGAKVGRESNLILNDRQIALAKNRTAEFKALLEKEFKVTIVSREDYKPDMSKAHDVTVFDARPPVLEVVRRSLYSQKNPLTLKKYLPDDFSAPAIFVGAAGDDMYITRKTKFQRCCICLGGHALNIRKEHPIFNTPHKVRLTLAMQYTPTAIHLVLHGGRWIQIHGETRPRQPPARYGNNRTDNAPRRIRNTSES